MSKPPVLQRHRRKICQQRGTTMIEVMVAALVLSVGLLGLTAMQTKALKTASGLATQQVMVQTLSAYNEARLSTPNTSISGGTQTDGVTQYVTIDGDLSRWCTALWRGVDAIGTFVNPNTFDLSYFNTFLGTYTPCGTAALTGYAEYWNRYGGSEFQHGRECDYIVPETHLITCTLTAGDDPIKLENLVWLR